MTTADSLYTAAAFTGGLPMNDGKRIPGNWKRKRNNGIYPEVSNGGPAHFACLSCPPIFGVLFCQHHSLCNEGRGNQVYHTTDRTAQTDGHGHHKNGHTGTGSAGEVRHHRSSRGSLQG